MRSAFQPVRGACLAFFCALGLGQAAGQPVLRPSDAPIEVTGQRFEWLPDERVVLITGAPLAVQGETRLAAQRFRVELRAAGAGADDTAAIAANPAENDIRAIHAIGEVRYSTPVEVATGEAALYDAVARQVTLTGDVVVTRGENVLRGEKLVIDIDSGRSVMESDPAGGRVRGLFYTKRARDAGGDS